MNGRDRLEQIPRNPIAHLRLERRSYIIGTVVVWWVVVVTMFILILNMKPELFHQSSNVTNLQQAMAQAEKVGPLTSQQELLVQLVLFVGAIALFFLNWRFSALLQRPRGAFGPPGAPRPKRWLWWFALALNSYFFFPQVLVTPLLAHWGTQEINLRSASPPPVSSGPDYGPPL